MKPMRGFGEAAVLASAVPAGIMASSSGSAIDTPIPRRTVRRDRCFLVMKCILVTTPRRLCLHSYPGSPLAGCPVRRMRRTLLLLRLGSLRLVRNRVIRGRALLELVTVDDPHDDRREAIVVFRAVAHDGADRRHIVIVDRATRRVGHQLLGDGLYKLVRVRRERVPKVHGPVDLRAVWQYARGVDGRPGDAIFRAPFAHRIEVLERETERVEYAVAGEAGGLVT